MQRWANLSQLGGWLLGKQRDFDKRQRLQAHSLRGAGQVRFGNDTILVGLQRRLAMTLTRVVRADVEM